jgi:cytoskeletal protein RodZ
MRGISLPHIAAVTKIGVRFLEYIEEDRFALLPPSAYLRGFLQQYARLVGLDPGEVAERYMARIR